MTAVRPLAIAMVKGFLRDRMALFFTVLFPLLFLFLFGGVFSSSSVPRSEVDVIGEVPLIDELSPDARAAFDEVFEVQENDDRDDALERVRKGDVAAAVEQRGDTVVLHFSRADPVTSARLQGTFSAFVDGANLTVAGVDPRFTLDAQQVEDESLEGIQYVAPGLLGWAIATSATFGAALTLVTWRESELLRRLRLAPVSGSAIVVARVLVTLLTSMLQMVLFTGLAVAVLGLELTGSWYLAIPLVLVGTLTFMAIGLLCGAVATSNEGASGLANLVVLPMAFLGGSFIPLDAAPDWIRTVSRVFPLRYLNEGMLDVMVRGEGPGAVVAPLLVMVGFTVVIGAIASRAMRWDKV